MDQFLGGARFCSNIFHSLYLGECTVEEMLSEVSAADTADEIRRGDMRRGNQKDQSNKHTLNINLKKAQQIRCNLVGLCEKNLIKLCSKNQCIFDVFSVQYIRLQRWGEGVERNGLFPSTAR